LNASKLVESRAMTDYAAARTMMVDTQIRTEGVTDYRILRTMGEVPRERFVPARARPFAYSDADIVVKEEGHHHRRMIRPATLARLIQAAAVAPGDFALVVGCATGYSAAVIAGLASSVIALESDGELAAASAETLTDLGIGNVAVVTGALEQGYPAEAPYDVIFLDGAVEHVPPDLFAQLREGGRLVAVVGYNRAASAMVYTRTDDDIGGLPVFDAFVPALPGFSRPREFTF
jgi:protein-L-isoaspartate(D-aspartate) O-methyltransferase